MSSWVERCAVALLAATALAGPAAPAAAAGQTGQTARTGATGATGATGPATRAEPVRAWPGIGRAATAAELAAWDIDVRPDFKGLPRGSGSVAQGQELWESKCASCHGIFGESNEFFAPLVGGTTAEDVQRGRVARLTDAAYPGRTTLMKLSTVSTLWDYINRAMPWNAPKSLQPDEVYALTAFLLNLGGVVPDDYVLSERNIAQVQARLPNRLGMSTHHALWPGKLPGATAQPDVKAQACMHDCAAEPQLASMLPDFARNAHGNLAEQNRMVGAQHGADTTRAAGAAPQRGPAPAAPARAGPPAGGAGTSGAPGTSAAAPTALLTRLGCTGCHAAASKLIGPSWAEVYARHGSRSDAQAYLAARIKAGGSGVWGAIPMPAQSLTEEDAMVLARWLAQGARP